MEHSIATPAAEDTEVVVVNTCVQHGGGAARTKAAGGDFVRWDAGGVNMGCGDGTQELGDIAVFHLAGLDCAGRRCCVIGMDGSGARGTMLFEVDGAAGRSSDGTVDSGPVGIVGSILAFDAILLVAKHHGATNCGVEVIQREGRDGLHFAEGGAGNAEAEVLELEG